jgi:hypothetical protein
LAKFTALARAAAKILWFPRQPDHKYDQSIDKRELVDCSLLWLSSYVARHHLAVVQQSGAKEQFYCSVQNINLNCKAEKVSKK